jgi:hypothetical protein
MVGDPAHNRCWCRERRCDLKIFVQEIVMGRKGALRPVVLATGLVLSLLLTACAGYRGGWESLPYVGEAPAAPPEFRTPFEARERSTLQFAGLTLGVNIHNQEQVYDRQVYMYVVPATSAGTASSAPKVDTGRTEVTVRVTAARDGFVFRPRLAVLGVAGSHVAAAHATEFGRGDPGGAPGVPGRQPAADAVALVVGKTHYFTLAFPMPVPSPQARDISLDLTKALQAPGQQALSLIRFLPVLWKQGYT